jgi:oxygen-independent coproporphyrinogen-3 oxidase
VKPSSQQDIPPIAVYVHWPFCESKCPYCDFNSHVRAAVDTDAFAAAYIREIDYFAGLMPAATCSSIFFGGGTPSLMPPSAVVAIIERILAQWPTADLPEITLEANPSSVEAGRFGAYREAGVNRLSLGVQSLRDQALEFLGRRHDAAEARRAMGLALDIFPRVNFDLIYARPGQTLREWKDELDEVLEYGAGHLSLYQLTIERGTAFYAAQKRGELNIPGEGPGLALFDLTQEITNQAGLPAYEISNHARAGEECRHNLNYWNGGTYIGVGPGAHGRFRGSEEGSWIASALTRSPEAWLKAVEKNKWRAGELTPLSTRDRALEILMMGLRLTKGIDKDSFATTVGAPVEEILSAAATGRAAESELLENHPDRIVVTPKGQRVLDRLLVEIVA